ncbi:MAG: rRNA maturation RNase YbeY [Phycisphaerales bacterium]|nr:rRNA maturation RNase YbeY [Phycisphaerales bacterium]
MIELVSSVEIDGKALTNLVRRMIPLLPQPKLTQVGSTSMGHPFHRVSIRIVDDTEMRRLHREFSNDDTTTDVLTFVQTDGQSGIEVDLALCSDEASRRSMEYGHSLANELALYLVHGLLHSVGFTDQFEDDARVMHEHEDRILTELGIGAVYTPRKGAP